MVKKLTEREFRRQLRHARASARRDRSYAWWPRIVRYDARHDRIELQLGRGIVVRIPRKEIRELRRATRAELREVAIAGEAVRWEGLDIDISIPGLLRQVLGESLFMREAGRIGGSVRSEAKAAAARANGAKGGRPRRRSR